MLKELEKKIDIFLRANKLSSVDNLLAAVSGGADSTAMLYALAALKTAGRLDADILVCHINHQLRGRRSDADQQFVVEQAKQLGFAIVTIAVDVAGYAAKNKLSIETAGRKLRIESLIDIAKANGIEIIATAHHADDNAETILQRLARGTGFRGIAGIWPVKNFGDEIKFIRPLLAVTRERILEYLNGRDIKWRTDQSNYDCKYRRNYIRHKLIGYLDKEAHRPIAEQLVELSESAQRFYSLVCRCADRLWAELTDCASGKIVLRTDGFLPQPPAVRGELIRRCLSSLGSGERDLTAKHFESIIRLAEQKTSGKKIELPNGFTAGYEYGDLIFAAAAVPLASEEDRDKAVSLKIPGTTRFNRYLIEAAVLDAENCELEEFKRRKDEFSEWFDFSRIEGALTIRFRADGDRFVPLSLCKEKRIGKFLTDAQIRQDIRSRTLVIADDRKIIWLYPVRISEAAKVNKKTAKILQLKIIARD